MTTDVDVGRRSQGPVSRSEVPCPVCDSTRAKVKYAPRIEVADPEKLYGAASGVRGTQRLVMCLDCGMLYESPRFADEVIVDAYRQSNEAMHDSQYPMRVESFRRALHSLRHRLPPPGSRVLDIGAAGGAFLEAAAEFGYHVVGLEPSNYLVEQGRLRGLDLSCGTIDDHPFPAGSFDLVCFWDVIEHVAQPRAALEAARALLAPGGVLLINVPDIGTWAARLAGERYWWILSVHLHHFDRKTLARLCERAGLRIFHFQPYWQTLEFGYLEGIAAQLGVPLAATLKALTPAVLQRLAIPYYASQTTALARVRT